MMSLLTNYIFQRVFYLGVTVIWSVCLALVIKMLAGSRWRVHLQWLIPLLIDTGLEVVFRLFLTQRSVFRTGYGGTIGYNPLILYIAKIAGVYGIYMMYRTFKTLVDRGSHVEPVSVASAASQEGVWPPPPTQ